MKTKAVSQPFYSWKSSKVPSFLILILTTRKSFFRKNTCSLSVSRPMKQIIVLR
jgi:hypothetical protein